MKDLYTGLDLGGTKLKIACCREENKFLYEKTIPISHMAYDDKLDDFIIECIERALERFPRPEWRLKAIGMGVPGTYYQGRVCMCTNIKGIDAEYLIDYFKARHGASFKIMNDVKCAALGEYSLDLYSGINNIIYINIGTGLSLGLILDGKLYSGRHNAAGEVAYYLTSLSTDENMGMPADNSAGLAKGGSGTRKLGLEEVFSGRALADRAKQAYSRLINSGGEPGYWFLEKTGGIVDKINTKLVFDGYKKGDKVIVPVVQEAVAHFSQALANICTVIDPEIIVFGGGVSRDIECVMDNIETYIKRIVPFPPKLKVAHLGSKAGIIGAIRLAMGNETQI